MSRILKAPYISLADSNVLIDNVINLEEYERELLENQEEQELIPTEEELQELQEDILETARKQAELIVENAKNEAKEIIEDAKQTIKQKGEVIYQENLEKGYNDGIEQAKGEAEEIIEQANSTLLEAEERKEKLVKELEPQLVEFVMDITENILTNSYKFNKDIAKFLVNRGLSEVKVLQDIKINVSKANYDVLTAEDTEGILNFDLTKNNITLIEDETMSETDCIIQTSFGDINCGITEQFNSLREALHNILQ